LVTLYDATSNLPIGTAITDGNGGYLISKIPAAVAGTSFYVIFSNLPGTAVFTTQNSDVTPGDITNGSDANISTGKTANFTLVPGQYLPTVDAGIKNVQLLPIKFTSFTALPKGNQVQLQWIVVEQINVVTYEAQASSDGRIFITIATIAASTNLSDKYDAIHSNPLAGLNYYRIKSIDKDGSISYSEIRKITFGKDGDVIIFPNPVSTGFINITLTGSMIGKAASVYVISIDGKLITQYKIANTNQIETLDASKLASGSYIIKIVTDAGAMINSKLEIIK
jgi:hypothetical protein